MLQWQRALNLNIYSDISIWSKFVAIFLPEWKSKFQLKFPLACSWEEHIQIDLQLPLQMLLAVAFES